MPSLNSWLCFSVVLLQCSHFCQCPVLSYVYVTCHSWACEVSSSPPPACGKAHHARHRHTRREYYTRYLSFHFLCPPTTFLFIISHFTFIFSVFLQVLFVFAYLTLYAVAFTLKPPYIIARGLVFFIFVFVLRRGFGVRFYALFCEPKTFIFSTTACFIAATFSARVAR